MYELTITGDFAAAHYLRDYKGPCEKLHGHNYKLELTIVSDKLNDIGLVVDFHELKSSFEKFLKHMDHVCLNDDVEFFKENNPSAENIAKYVYQGFSKTCEGYKVKDVRVWESDTSGVTYYEL